MSLKQEALDTLVYNNINAMHMLNMILNHPMRTIIIKDKFETDWKFISRTNCHTYIMAKTDDMERYHIVYSVSNY